MFRFRLQDGFSFLSVVRLHSKIVLHIKIVGKRSIRRRGPARKVPCVPILPEGVGDVVCAMAPGVRRNRDITARIPPALRRRQLPDQGAGAHPGPGADRDRDAVGGLLVEVFRRAAVGVPRVAQERLVIHVHAELPQVPHLRRRKVAVPQYQMPWDKW